ncbi:MAG: UxaA family hydrolase [Candidatus Dormibacteraceae bacterium]
MHDVAPGRRRVIYMDSDREAELDSLEAVPLGHKTALADLEADAEVIEYGVVVGRSRAPIRRGEMVHVHNLRSARWEASR